MYLFVDKKEGLSQIPESLRELFGAPELVLDMLLTPNKKLARSDASEILLSIKDKGYFLQMPPPPEELTAVAKAREMMPAKGRSGCE